ncbi:MAG: hypothetical protein AB7U25_10270 [Vicinamibacterales bacterium]
MDVHGDIAAGLSRPTRTSSLALSILAGCVRRGGPGAAEHAQVAAALSVLSIDRVAPERITEVLAPTLTPECLHGWAHLRPLGHLGDHVLVERILSGAVSDDPRLAGWDAFCHAQPIAKAIRRRAATCRTYCAQLDDQRPLGGSVLVTGAGAAHDLHAYLTAHPQSRLRVTCVEGHAQAAAAVDVLAATVRQPMTVVAQDVATLRLRQQFELVWAPTHGCCLDDRAWVGLASRLYERVAPGGALVLGNVAAGNPSRPYLEVVAGWFLSYRAADQLADLAQATAGPEARVTIEREPEGAYLFVRIPRG